MGGRAYGDGGVVGGGGLLEEGRLLENYGEKWRYALPPGRSTEESNKKAKRSKLEEPFLCAQKNKRRVVEILGSRLRDIPALSAGPPREAKGPSVCLFSSLSLSIDVSLAVYTGRNNAYMYIQPIRVIYIVCAPCMLCLHIYVQYWHRRLGDWNTRDEQVSASMSPTQWKCRKCGRGKR